MSVINHYYLQDIKTEIESTGSTVSFNWSTASGTHIGRVRSVNEDALFYNEDQGLWVVADGMGGHSRGDRASREVVDGIRGFARADDLTESIKDIETRFLLANSTCRTLYRHKVIGSTVVALLAFGPLSIFLWAGDSRVYRLRKGNLTQMTEDHSVVQEKYRRGELEFQDIQDHPSANILTRAIGVHQDLRIEMQHAAIEPGDRYLLCSDGLYGDLQCSEIQSLLGGGDVEEALGSLIDLALQRGGKDNITGILAQAK